ncbi:carbohydrate ABC transporter permease [Agromyces allii]|uniref:Carbohydrate ABC transporter permease n=1 Tax=Agromyces allii TaxID=393607 RepID=A0ABP5C1U4_9MICO|nr:carbohydrate ABC transporter permease [Agromyces allii]
MSQQDTLNPIAPLEAPASVRKPRRKRSRTPQEGQKASVWVYIGVFIALALFGIPFIWILLTSVATQQQFAEGALALLDLSSPAWSNFYEAVTRIDFGAYTINTIFLSTITAVLTTLSSATVGFAFARLRAPGKNALFTVILATMLIPSIATLIPTYILFARVGLTNTYWPWVLWGIAGTPYLIFLFRQFFSAIPIELEDAAIIDGAGWFRSYIFIFLPLARPAILTSLLLSFTWTWGDYLAPALLLNLKNTTLAVATAAGYLDPRGEGIVTVQAAGAVLYLLPVVIVFLFTQKYFMGSGLGSSVKG